VISDTSGDDFTAGIQVFDGSFLVGAHQTAVVFDISAEDGAHLPTGSFIRHTAPPQIKALNCWFG
jgi:hypothetical protein